MKKNCDCLRMNIFLMAGLSMSLIAVPAKAQGLYQTDPQVMRAHQDESEKKSIFQKIGDKFATLGKSQSEKERIIRRRDQDRQRVINHKKKLKREIRNQKEIRKRNKKLERERTLQEKERKERAQARRNYMEKQNKLREKARDSK